MSLDIHKDIISKLEYFYNSHNVPHIMFHGESGNGKRTIVNNFIRLIYNNNNSEIKNSVIHVNCAHGKGIKFIREELKHFAKTHINSQNGGVFKTILLFNADKLTIDAQSALRRCIELFSHTTRFFLIVEDKYKLLKPILSRFCEIYVPQPVINNTSINLYTYNISQLINLKTDIQKRNEWLKKELINFKPSRKEICVLSSKIYEKGYSALDIIKLIENPKFMTNLSELTRIDILMNFNKVRLEFRNEKLLIVYILNILVISLDKK